MNKLMLALIASIAAAPVAAQDVSIWAELEYAAEAQTLETTLGADFNVSSFTITPSLIADDKSGDFDFTSAEIEAAYSINSNVDAFVRLESDEDFNYDESVFGVALRF